MLVGKSYHRPSCQYFRLVYLLLPLGWLCLAGSIYYGVRAQQAYLAYLLVTKTTVEGATWTINSDMRDQVFWMLLGLGCFLAWLFMYLLWWIFTKSIDESRGGA